MDEDEDRQNDVQEDPDILEDITLNCDVGPLILNVCYGVMPCLLLSLLCFAGSTDHTDD